MYYDVLCIIILATGSKSMRLFTEGDVEEEIMTSLGITESSLKSTATDTDDVEFLRMTD